MGIFAEYAMFYDILYQDKDYMMEANYIDGLIRRYHARALSILDLGCGTGRHAQALSAMGYRVLGVDISEQMISAAKEFEIEGKLQFSTGDVRSFAVSEIFDVVTSLFHVVSYQSGNADINATFNTAYRHLDKNGIFIFDCWYGPGVLTDRPAVRVKRFADECFEITRIAEPLIYLNENLVDVDYQMFVRDKSENKNVREIKETHRLRYLFKPEVELFLKQNNFKLVGFFEFMSDQEPTQNTWNACFVCQKS